jgi:hypothetical protein
MGLSITLIQTDYGGGHIWTYRLPVVSVRRPCIEKEVQSKKKIEKVALLVGYLCSQIGNLYNSYVGTTIKIFCVKF